MFKKILVCLDGSKAAEQILDYISEDAALAGSKLVLLRVISLPEITVPIQVPGVSGVPISTGATMKHMTTKENEATAYLEQTAEQLRPKNLNIEYEVVPGIPGEAIVDYAQENDIKLIAIGTHGHSAARRFFLGSTADYVLRHSNLPVLTIRPNI
jgi:nucleotide-binding universal stress UspA family protein